MSEHSVQPNITKRDGQLNQNDNEKRDGQDKDKQASEEKKFDVDEDEVNGQRDGRRTH